MKPITVTAHIHSLKVEMNEVTLLGPNYLFGRVIPNAYVFKYGNILCCGIFNGFVFEYYVDDLYGVVNKENENYYIYKKYISGEN